MKKLITMLMVLYAITHLSTSCNPNVFGGRKQTTMDTAHYNINGFGVDADSDDVISYEDVEIVLANQVYIPDRLMNNVSAGYVVDYVETEVINEVGHLSAGVGQGIEQIPVQRAHIVYDVPDTIELYTYDVVTLRLSVIDNDTTIYLGLNHIRGEDTVMATSLMGADLLDVSPTGDVFTIKSLSSREQRVNDLYYTEWKWSVAPNKSGDHPVRIVLKMKTDNGVIDRPVLDKTIHIYAKAGKVVLNEAKRAWWAHWEWLMTTIIIPLFVFFYNKRKKKDEQST